MNVDGLRKPAFFAYQFLGELYDAEIPIGTARVIVTKKETDLRILLWDYSPPKADAPNNPFYTRDIPATQLPDAALSFSGLTEGTYGVSRVGTGWHRNDVYDAYLTLGKPPGPNAHLPPEVLAQLQSASSGETEAMSDIVVSATGKAELRIPMRTNDVWLVSVTRK
jgi:xylan 1,4-beta-xylosidase